jgi:hypothetical protein
LSELFDVDSDLRALLATLDPKARTDLRRVLILGQPHRDAIASELMRFRDENGWAAPRAHPPLHGRRRSGTTPLPEPVASRPVSGGRAGRRTTGSRRRSGGSHNAGRRPIEALVTTTPKRYEAGS